MLQKLPSFLFGALLILLIGVLIPRVFALTPLYTDAGIRSTVRINLRKLSAYQGWILSDMIVRRVTPRTLTFHYRPHHRGDGFSACYIFYFVTDHVAPCANE